MPGATRCYPPALPTNRISYLHASSLSLIASSSPYPSHSRSLALSPLLFFLPFPFFLSVYRSRRIRTSTFNLFSHQRDPLSLYTSVALSAPYRDAVLPSSQNIFLGNCINETALDLDESHHENDHVERLRSAADSSRNNGGAMERTKIKGKKK